MSFSETDIRAIVRSGELSDPEDEEYLVQVLIERRNKIGATWLTRLSSFDEFELTDEGQLKFGHLASYYDFKRRPECQLSWFRFNNKTGEREPISEFQPKNYEGYSVAVISSTEGEVDVYVRTMAGKSQIVGVDRK